MNSDIDTIETQRDEAYVGERAGPQGSATLVPLAERALVAGGLEARLGRAGDWSLDFAALIGLPSSFLAVLASRSWAHATLTVVFVTAVAALLGRLLPRMLLRHLRQTPILLVALSSGTLMAAVTALPTLLQAHHSLDATGVAAVTSLTITTLFTTAYIASRALNARLGLLRLAMPLVFTLGVTTGWLAVLLAIRLQHLLH